MIKRVIPFLAILTFFIFQETVSTTQINKTTNHIFYKGNATVVDSKDDYLLVDLLGTIPVDVRYKTVPVSQKYSFNNFKDKMDIQDDSLAFALYSTINVEEKIEDPNEIKKRIEYFRK